MKRNKRHNRRDANHVVMISIACLAMLGAAVSAQKPEIPRMPNGKPDLSGTYDAATLTPLQRPVELGDKAF